MDITISANDLKVKGVTLIDSVVDENQSAIITVRGVEKYVVLKISDYNKIREMELDLAIQESKADIAAGRFHADGVEEHMKRVTNV
ncbi:MAG: type II toxin-antitoxin system prevent-host-death family antitoxin [Treponema sp.]|nr:type II toxin-antitoxin system prevent-host-death family antitoxin [Treponema sp.]